MTEFSLGLEISPRILGRAARPLMVEVVRALTPEDLTLLAVEGARADPERAALKRLSQRHHALARLLASGASTTDAAAIMSYNLTTISRLKSDPAFNELLSFYRKDLDVQLRTNHERLVGITADALDELHSRIEEEPEKFTVNQLVEISKMGADRTGNGPSSSSVTVSVNMNIADRMKAAREQARLASDPKLIEGTIRDAAE